MRCLQIITFKYDLTAQHNGFEQKHEATNRNPNISEMYAVMCTLLSTDRKIKPIQHFCQQGVPTLTLKSSLEILHD